MSGRLSGKVAIVTGAASGIGRRVAERYAAEGAHVLITDIDDAKGLELAHHLGAQTVYRRCDVTAEADIAAAVDDAVARHGRLDVLVSNAGAPGKSGPIDQIDAAQCGGGSGTLSRDRLRARHSHPPFLSSSCAPRSCVGMFDGRA